MIANCQFSSSPSPVHQLFQWIRWYFDWCEMAPEAFTIDVKPHSSYFSSKNFTSSIQHTPKTNPVWYYYQRHKPRRSVLAAFYLMPDFEAGLWRKGHMFGSESENEPNRASGRQALLGVPRNGGRGNGHLVSSLYVT